MRICAIDWIGCENSRGATAALRAAVAMKRESRRGNYLGPSAACRPGAIEAVMTLKNAVESHFTAKQQRAQRTYIKNKIHLFGEVLDHTKLNSKPCLSFVSLRLCVGNLNSYCRV